MNPSHHFGRLRRYQGAHERLHEGAVECEIGLRNAGRSRKAAFVRRIVAAKRTNIVKRSRLAAHHPLAGHEVRISSIPAFRLKHRFVEPRRQHVDEIDVARELVVLLASHTTAFAPCSSRE